MPTGFDLLEQSHDFRVHWLKRTAAAIIDIAIVFTPISLALLTISYPDKMVLAGIFSGIGWFFYSAILEGLFGETWGKRVMHFKVVSMANRHPILQSTIRSVPKIFWYAFLPFDVLAGWATEGDPRQRLTDRVGRTTVVLMSDKMAGSLRQREEKDVSANVLKVVSTNINREEEKT